MNARQIKTRTRTHIACVCATVCEWNITTEKYHTNDDDDDDDWEEVKCSMCECTRSSTMSTSTRRSAVHIRIYCDSLSLFSHFCFFLLIPTELQATSTVVAVYSRDVKLKWNDGKVAEGVEKTKIKLKRYTLTRLMLLYSFFFFFFPFVFVQFENKILTVVARTAFTHTHDHMRHKFNESVERDARRRM